MQQNLDALPELVVSDDTDPTTATAVNCHRQRGGGRLEWIRSVLASRTGSSS